MRILVVDDNVDAARTLATSLTLLGHECRVEHDGRAALEAAPTFRPEVVFCDLGMPGMDGCEVARRLRAHPHTAGVLLAAITGWGDEQHRQNSLAAGFDVHLTKPVQRAEMRTILARAGDPGRD